MLSVISSRLTRLKRLPAQAFAAYNAHRRCISWSRATSARQVGVRPQLTPARWAGWWGPPRQGWDDDLGGGGDEYVYRMKLGQGDRVEYDVRVEGREVRVRGRVVDRTQNRRSVPELLGSGKH